MIDVHTPLHRPIQWLFTLDGDEVENFTQLKNHCEYVAAYSLPFQKNNYSKKKKQDWNKDDKVSYKDPEELDSNETIELYLRQKEIERHSQFAHRSLSTFNHNAGEKKKWHAREAPKIKAIPPSEPYKQKERVFKTRSQSQTAGKKDTRSLESAMDGRIV
jgi:hypothetical protein